MLRYITVITRTSQYHIYGVQYIVLNWNPQTQMLSSTVQFLTQYLPIDITETITSIWTNPTQPLRYLTESKPTHTVRMSTFRHFSRKLWHLPAVVHVWDSSHVWWKRFSVTVIHYVITVIVDAAPPSPVTQYCTSVLNKFVNGLITNAKMNNNHNKYCVC